MMIRYGQIALVAIGLLAMLVANTAHADPLKKYSTKMIVDHFLDGFILNRPFKKTDGSTQYGMVIRSQSPVRINAAGDVRPEILQTVRETVSEMRRLSRMRVSYSSAKKANIQMIFAKDFADVVDRYPSIFGALVAKYGVFTDSNLRDKIKRKTSTLGLSVFLCDIVSGFLPYTENFTAILIRSDIDPVLQKRCVRGTLARSMGMLGRRTKTRSIVWAVAEAKSYDQRTADYTELDRIGIRILFHPRMPDLGSFADAKRAAEKIVAGMR